MDERHNTLNYVEMKTTDLEASKAFFGSVFGWTFTDYGPDYASFHGAAVDGGFWRVDEVDGTGEFVLPVLYSSDLEATVEAVTANGGEILRPIFDFPGGRRFHCRIPGGIHFATWSEPAEESK
ncbi:MAG: VOC family protein [Planctomycetota bacterium]|jgi:predicted enzyme related to lactoylglutathione lyase